MTGTPPILVKPRRFASPFADQRAKLEPIQQPLYSCYIFDAAAAPSQALFFQYAVGNQVATNASSVPTATTLHTNMIAAGNLPAPKCFLICGMRVVPVELTSGLSGVLSDTGAYTTAVTFTGQDSGLLEDLTRILYGSYLDLFVGTKNYFQGPTWFAPANTGISGVSDTSLGYGATPIATSTIQYIQTFHSAGRFLNFDRYPILVPPQQNFVVSLNFPQTTKPTIGTARLVYAVLEGVYGREVQ